MPETELEMIRRHIAVGERNVSAQRQRIAQMKLREQPTDEAERLLVIFEDSLGQHQEHLARYLQTGNWRR
jgi:hypothetical protein